MKNLLPLWLLKLVTLLLRISGRGSGTALPGLLAEKYCGYLLDYFGVQLKQTIIITGTNGKTSTQTILAELFADLNVPIVRNASGSNMRRGLLAEFINQADWKGRLHHQVAVLEVEEATLPRIIHDIPPDYLIVTNLFRDQLDAYGELDRTKGFIVNALNQLEDKQKTAVVLNGDDPLVASIASVVEQKCYFVCIRDKAVKIKYEGGSTKVDCNLTATGLSKNSSLGYSFYIKDKPYDLGLPGVFQVYNTLFSLQTMILAGYESKDFNEALTRVEPAYGRGEMIYYNDLQMRILLMKNPAGLNLNLELLKGLENIVLIILLNDNIADGRDVSWIWDAEFEILPSLSVKRIICAGTRMEDLLLRLKYTYSKFSKVDEGKYSADGVEILTAADMAQLNKIVNKNEKQDKIFVLPTYTAMLQFRKYFSGKSIHE